MSAAFSPDGKRIVTASRDRTARVWDAATGSRSASRSKAMRVLCSSAAFSPDGTAHRHRVRGRDGAGLGRRDRQADRRAAQRP